MRARRSSREIRVGQWGLIECNDPTFVFTFNFHIDPESDAWGDQTWNLYTELKCHPVTGYQLISRAIEVGYNPTENFVEWFATRLLLWLKEHDPEPDEDGNEDPFPQLNDIQEHDLSPWIRPK